MAVGIYSYTATEGGAWRSRARIVLIDSTILSITLWELWFSDLLGGQPF